MKCKFLKYTKHENCGAVFALLSCQCTHRVKVETRRQLMVQGIRGQEKK